MLVYNVTSKSRWDQPIPFLSNASFENVPKLFTTLIKVRQLKVTPVVLVGTKCWRLFAFYDTTCSWFRRREKSFKRWWTCIGNSLSLQICWYILVRKVITSSETSAKTADGVADAFNSLFETIKSVHDMSGPVRYKGFIGLTLLGAIQVGVVETKEGRKISEKAFHSHHRQRHSILQDTTGKCLVALRLKFVEQESLSDTSQLKGVIPLQNCLVDLNKAPLLERRWSDTDAPGYTCQLCCHWCVPGIHKKEEEVIRQIHPWDQHLLQSELEGWLRFRCQLHIVVSDNS